MLLEALIKSAEAAGIWTIQCAIFPENHASLRLHERAGFRVVGTRQRIGRMTYEPLTWRLARRHHDRTPQPHRADLTVLTHCLASTVSLPGQQ